LKTNRLALVLVYNHRYEANIETLERIYARRFSKIFHLVPFYSGAAPGVISVAESSHHFQGFFAQAVEPLAADLFDYYVFCADDLLLHPALDERNLAARLSLNSRSGYIKSVTSLAQVPFGWEHMSGALVAFAPSNGVEWQRELPSAREARDAFTAHGMDVGGLTLRHFRRGIRFAQFVQLVLYLRQRASLWLRDSAVRLNGFPYPLAPKLENAARSLFRAFFRSV